ncbi:YjbF family lipoprotein [Halopseudomonas sabulinigri]|uniref:Group 4 capsule polysaccharide lipoprotein gfcB, YjbF n=1 Tax=Halopseudomonas sabulinigri TaxID=472181 RepID=A0ABP9ZQ41_9GAMM
MNSFYGRGPLALLFLALGGCNSLTATTIETINLAIKGDLNKIPLEQITAVENDSLLIKAGQAEGLYVRQESYDGRTDWVGLNENVQTNHGRLTQLVGYANDVLAPLNEQDPFSQGLLNVTEGTQVLRYVDYPLAYQSGLEQYATYNQGPYERIQVLDQLIALQRVDEQIWMPQLNYEATNYYWLDPNNGHIRRSIQHIAPELPALDITLVRLPATERPQ